MRNGPLQVHEVGNAASYAERPVRPSPSPTDRMALRAIGTALARFDVSKRRYRRFVVEVLALADPLTALDGDDFAAAVADCRFSLVRSQGRCQHGIVTAFALTREATRRMLGFAHHPVQIMGGLVLLEGRFAEMHTGEGKTTTALLAAATSALAGIPVHVVTANDYLASRDSAQLRPIYTLLGLGVGLVVGEQSPDERRSAYLNDVTYCTNKDLVFDYLRDRLTLGSVRGYARRRLRELADSAGLPLLLRGLHYAIVDEVDSILIDEARTPLILSQNIGDDDVDAARIMALDIAVDLVENFDFILHRPGKGVDLLAAAEPKIARAAVALSTSPVLARAAAELIAQALSALHCYERNVDYIVSDGKVQIVDEFTGRVMLDRSWENGLHQMVELKEGCNHMTW